jgi:uncharacterized membrane protein YdjX (TVP38/TMEM64 family)
LKTYAKKIILFVIIIAVIVLIRISNTAEYLTFENLKRSSLILHEPANEHYLLAVLLYMVLYAVSVAFSIPGAAVLTLAGGFLFGTISGALYVNVGATTGAVIAFLSARYLTGNWIQKRYGPQLKRFNEELSKNGHLYLLTLRFIPVFPFFIINILAGLTNIPLKTFLWTTSLGIIPASLVYAFAGTQLNTIKVAGDIFSWRVITALFLLSLLSLLPVIINKIKSRSRKQRDAT